MVAVEFKKYILIPIIFIVIILSTSNSFAQSASIANGLSYLQSTQSPEGYWGDVSEVPYNSFVDTCTVAETLKYLNETGTPYNSAIQWINTTEVSNNDYLFTKMLILSHAGFDVSTIRDYLLSVRNYDGGWGITEEFESDIKRTALALQALRSVNYPDQTVISKAINYLLSTQNPDGGWGFYQGDRSNVYMTALVTITLQQFSRTTFMATAINKASSYLITHQNADGGFGSSTSSESTIYETALAYIALVGAITDNTVLGNAINYLKSTQLPDGSWLQDPYSTALALRALYLSENRSVPLPPPDKGTVTGRVVDASTNQPLAGVSVVSGQVSAITTNKGEFTLSDIPQGSQTITFSLTGYTTASVTVNITAGSIIDLGTIPLSSSPTTGIIKGTVTDADNGQPLSDVTITVTGSFTGSIITGADGTFIFDNVTPGTVTITASKTGYYSVTGTGTVVAGGILFFNPRLSRQPPLTNTGDLTGRVFDASTNRPIQGVTISISQGPSTTTDSQGIFFIKDITPGTYQVTISAFGYISQVYQVMIIAGVTTDMQIVYLMPSPQSTTITGRVTDVQTGNPIVGADVVVVGTTLSAKTDSSGIYTITGINLLEFNLKASATGYDSLAYNVKTRDYGTYTIDLALNPSQVSDLRIISLSTDKRNYMADENLLITAIIENKGITEIQGLVMAEIQDPEGNVIAVVTPQDPNITLAPSASIKKTIHWNTGQFSPGDYTIILIVTDPQTLSYTNPRGDLLAEMAKTITIIPTPALGGSISLNPPVAHVDIQRPVMITAVVRNTGNIPVTTTLRLDVTFNGTVVYTEDSEITDLQVNNTQDLDLGSFIPHQGGNYSITLSPMDPSIISNISTTLYVGPHAEATFTVTPDKAFPGDVRVRGSIHIRGAGVATGSAQDPLVLLIKEAIQKGVNYEQPAVMAWHNRFRCYGCHIQTQAFYGLQESRKRATVDPSVTLTLWDALKGWQKSDGSVWSHHPYWFTTQTSLALWAYTSWHDKDEARPYILRSADYLLGRQATNGSWMCDYCGGWWGSNVSLTAITIIGISEAYKLSNDQRYLTSIIKAVQYLLTPNLIPSTDNMQRAHQVIGLEAALSVITDHALRDQITDTINTAISRLKSVQRMDGGWGRFTWNISDSLVTSQVLYAMAKAGLTHEDPSLRKATIFLLNNQAADGSWYSQNYIMSTRLATTTWVIISLPIALERIGGIDTDLYLTLPDNVLLDSSTPIPADSSDSNYHWKILGVMEEGKDVFLDLTIKSLLIGEKRKVATSVILTFMNTFTGETMSLPIEIPVVTGIAPITLGLSTDKTVYTANEDVQITVTLENLIDSNRSGTLEVKIMDLNAGVISTVVNNQPITLGSYENRVLNYTWNTGKTLAGDYKVYVHFTEGKDVIARADTPVRISPVKTLLSRVITDRISYKANEQVTITSTIQSTSQNYIFENLMAKIDISNQQSVIYKETQTIPVLIPGQLTELKTHWNTSTNPKGIYTVTLEVIDGMTVLSTSTTAFEILGSKDTGEGLAGTITAFPDPVYQGDDEAITYTITNRGNEDISDLKVKVIIVDPDTQEVKNTFEGTIDLSVNTTASGNFISSTSDLIPRIYLAILQVRSPTMPDSKTLASTTFEVRPRIEVTKTIPDIKNVLVWLNYSCVSEQWSGDSEEKCVNKRLIQQALNDLGVNYHMVYDKKDFETELRNPLYTDFMILGDHNPVEDHFAEELREQVYSGKGLISSLFNRQDLDEDVFGIRFTGYLSARDYPVEFIESEIAPQSNFHSYGRALKIDVLNSDEIIAWIVEVTKRETGRYPGIIMREYREGRVLFYAFDLGMSSKDYEQFATLIKNSLNYIHTFSHTNSFYPNQFIPVEITIKGSGGSFDIRLSETYSPEIRLYDHLTGEWITENPWVRDIHLESDGAVRLLYYILTPDTMGTYNLKTDVSYLENGIYRFYRSLETDIVVLRDMQAISIDIISALNALSVSGEERAKVDNAINYIQKVMNRSITSDIDVEQNIHDILKAVDSIFSLTTVDITEIRLMMDGLLKVWEGRWWLETSFRD